MSLAKLVRAIPSLKAERIGQTIMIRGGLIFIPPDWPQLLITTVLVLVPSLMCWSAVAPHVVAALAGVLLTTIVLYFLLMTGLTDPGIVPRRSELPMEEDRHTILHASRNRTETIVVYRDGQPEEEQVERKWCYTCFVLRPPRGSHCPRCDCCVERMDHHCPWTGTCIGKRNHRYFVGFVSTASVLCLYGGAMSVWATILSAKEVDDVEGDAFWDGLKKQAYLPLILISFVSIAFCFVFTLAAYHWSLVFSNETTHEQMKGLHRNRNPYDRGIVDNVKEILLSDRGMNVADKIRAELFENDPHGGCLPDDTELANVPTIGIPSTTSTARRDHHSQVNDDDEDPNDRLFDMERPGIDVTSPGGHVNNYDDLARQQLHHLQQQHQVAGGQQSESEHISYDQPLALQAENANPHPTCEEVENGNPLYFRDHPEGARTTQQQQQQQHLQSHGGGTSRSITTHDGAQRTTALGANAGGDERFPSSEPNRNGVSSVVASSAHHPHNVSDARSGACSARGSDETLRSRSEHLTFVIDPRPSERRQVGFEAVLDAASREHCERRLNGGKLLEECRACDRTFERNETVDVAVVVTPASVVIGVSPFGAPQAVQPTSASHHHDHHQSSSTMEKTQPVPSGHQQRTAQTAATAFPHGAGTSMASVDNLSLISALEAIGAAKAVVSASHTVGKHDAHSSSASGGKHHHHQHHNYHHHSSQHHQQGNHRALMAAPTDGGALLSFPYSTGSLTPGVTPTSSEVGSPRHAPALNTADATPIPNPHLNLNPRLHAHSHGLAVTPPSHAQPTALPGPHVSSQQLGATGGSSTAGGGAGRPVSRPQSAGRTRGEGCLKTGGGGAVSGNERSASVRDRSVKFDDTPREHGLDDELEPHHQCFDGSMLLDDASVRSSSVRSHQSFTTHQSTTGMNSQQVTPSKVVVGTTGQHQAGSSSPASPTRLNYGGDANRNVTTSGPGGGVLTTTTMPKPTGAVVGSILKKKAPPPAVGAPQPTATTPSSLAMSPVSLGPSRSATTGGGGNVGGGVFPPQPHGLFPDTGRSPSESSIASTVSYHHAQQQASQGQQRIKQSQPQGQQGQGQRQGQPVGSPQLNASFHSQHSHTSARPGLKDTAEPLSPRTPSTPVHPAVKAAADAARRRTQSLQLAASHRQAELRAQQMAQQASSIPSVVGAVVAPTALMPKNPKELPQSKQTQQSPESASMKPSVRSSQQKQQQSDSMQPQHHQQQQYQQQRSASHLEPGRTDEHRRLQGQGQGQGQGEQGRPPPIDEGRPSLSIAVVASSQASQASQASSRSSSQQSHQHHAGHSSSSVSGSPRGGAMSQQQLFLANSFCKTPKSVTSAGGVVGNVPRSQSQASDAGSIRSVSGGETRGGADGGGVPDQYEHHQDPDDHEVRYHQHSDHHVSAVPFTAPQSPRQASLPPSTASSTALELESRRLCDDDDDDVEHLDAEAVKTVATVASSPPRVSDKTDSKQEARVSITEHDDSPRSSGVQQMRRRSLSGERGEEEEMSPGNPSLATASASQVDLMSL